MKTKLILLIIILLGAGLGTKFFLSHETAAAVEFRTTPVTRGSLESTISATGTVEPQEVVDVGAQVAGLLKSLGTDDKGKTIDYGSQVEQGTVLAKIDDSLYASDVAQAQAQLKQDQATLQSAQANVAQMTAKLDQAQRDWERAQKLGPSEALAQTTYDGYRFTYEAAQANLSAAKAAVEQANATITQHQAALARSQENLDYCTIKSPVDGVIIDRRVNIGQTVVSSLNAPSLFLIAKDLKKMEVWVSVNEADIGNIHVGQPATFTVDAFPGQVFQGSVAQVRLNATMTQNVVTYTVVVSTDNSNGKLLPYLTANVQFELAKRDNVLLAPNTALNWTPSPDLIEGNAPAASSAGSASASVPTAAPATAAASAASSTSAQAGNGNGTHGGGHGGQGHGHAGHGGAGANAGDEKQGTIWTPDGSHVRAIPVQLGISNGAETEISGPGVDEGLPVVIGQQENAAHAGGHAGGGGGGTAGSSGSVNPFVPQIRRGGGH